MLTYHSWRVRRTGIHLIKESVCNPYVEQDVARVDGDGFANEKGSI